MAGEYQDRVRSLDELYAMFDHDRLAAAKMTEATFQVDVNAAITNISEISSVASARVLADTQVASAKMLIDAEVVATRLSAGAEMAILDYKSRVLGQDEHVSPDVVASMITEIGRTHSERLSDSARHSVESIERDAAAAIAKLKEIGISAIGEIRGFAVATSLKTQEAAVKAAERLEAFRRQPYTMAETATEADAATEMVIDAAEQAAILLHEAADAALRNLVAVTNEASSAILAAAKAAEDRVEAALQKALARIREVMRLEIANYRGSG